MRGVPNYANHPRSIVKAVILRSLTENKGPVNITMLVANYSRARSCLSMWKKKFSMFVVKYKIFFFPFFWYLWTNFPATERTFFLIFLSKFFILFESFIFSNVFLCVFSMSRQCTSVFQTETYSKKSPLTFSIPDLYTKWTTKRRNPRDCLVI